MKKDFQLKLLSEAQGCETSVWQHSQYAHASLAQLESNILKVESIWVRLPPHQDLPSNAQYAELSRLTDERNRLSDSVRVYSAMAVEGFLNLYGVLRLGQQEFDSQFERLGLIPKAKMLLLVCDSISITNNDPLLVALDKIAKSRNELVHPKSREFKSFDDLPPRNHSLIPEAARESVKNMLLFFHEFVAAVPTAAYIVPKPSQSR